ncbi:MAG TPA: hypothetical protein VIJ43_05320 [Burkholderiales bacterium]
MFFVTWWIEHRAVARKLPEQPRKRIALATFATNVLSYAVLAAAIAWMPFSDSTGKLAGAGCGLPARDRAGVRSHGTKGIRVALISIN